MLFDGAMNVKLADYGRSAEYITQQLEQEQENPPRLGPGEEHRQLYLAPELLRGDTTTTAADIWSLGCITARMGSLKPLYGQAGASPHIVMMRIATGLVLTRAAG